MTKKTYSEEDYKEIIAGKVALPNFEPVSPDAFCNSLAAGGHSMIPKWGTALLRDGDKPWAFYFLTNYSSMGAKLDGSGYVTIYRSPTPIIGRFAICKHEKEMGAGADPSRGWHPGHCKKCGMDMTIDSGD